MTTAVVGERGRRDLWLTSAIGLALLVAIPPIAITGLLSNAAYDPRVGQNVLAQGRALGPFDFYLFHWPTSPSWLYAATQGIHVTLGLAVIPLVIAKLWSALRGAMLPPREPQLAGALERVLLIFLSLGLLFEFVSGLWQIEYFSPGGTQLVTAHYYAGWIVIVAFCLHAVARVPTMRSALATRRALGALASASAAAEADGEWPETALPQPTEKAASQRAETAPPQPAKTAPPQAADPALPQPEAAMTRRLVLGTAAVGSLLLLVQGAAQSIGGPVRELGLLLPRGNATGTGANDFEVNGTAAAAGLGHGQLGDGWRVHVTGRRTGARRTLSRAQLLALPQHTYSLPISCREGWSTTQRWTGVRLRDLAALVGEHDRPQLTMSSLDGAVATLAGNQVAADESLLALHVNGAPLSYDHGYPARVIVPGAIGVNCLKWISGLEFRRE